MIKNGWKNINHGLSPMLWSSFNKLLIVGFAGFATFQRLVFSLRSLLVPSLEELF